MPALAGFVALTALALPWGGGCAGPAPVRLVPSEGTAAELTGDWNDMIPSVDAACGRSEVAIEAIEEETPTRKVLRMRTIFDEPGRMTITRSAEGPDPTHASAWVRLGRIGDAKREASLIADTKIRLKQLQGRDYHPLPEDW